MNRDSSESSRRTSFLLERRPVSHWRYCSPAAINVDSGSAATSGSRRKLSSLSSPLLPLPLPLALLAAASLPAAHAVPGDTLPRLPPPWTAALTTVFDPSGECRGRRFPTSAAVVDSSPPSSSSPTISPTAGRQQGVGCCGGIRCESGFNCIVDLVTKGHGTREQKAIQGQGKEVPHVSSLSSSRLDCFSTACLTGAPSLSFISARARISEAWWCNE